MKRWKGFEVLPVCVWLNLPGQPLVISHSCPQEKCVWHSVGHISFSCNWLFFVKKIYTNCTSDVRAIVSYDCYNLTWKWVCYGHFPKLNKALCFSFEKQIMFPFSVFIATNSDNSEFHGATVAISAAFHGFCQKSLGWVLCTLIPNGDSFMSRFSKGVLFSLYFYQRCIMILPWVSWSMCSQPV